MDKLLYSFFFLILFPGLIQAQSFASNKSTVPAEELTRSSADVVNAPAHIALSEVSAHIGKTVTVCGKVYGAKLMKNVIGKPTLMNLGGSNANERIEVRIRFTELSNFNNDPEKLFLNKNVCITGTITNQFGFAEINIDSANQKKLLREMQVSKPQSVAQQIVRKISIASNAYLFAGPGLKEPIITHLKAGSIIIADYIKGSWTYVKVVERNGSGALQQCLYGFVRNQAIGFTRHNKPAKQKNSYQVI